MIDLRNVLAAVLLAGAAGAAAQAADLPQAASPVPYAVPAYNWSGFYVGGHVGGLFGMRGDKFGDVKDYLDAAYEGEPFGDDDEDANFIVGGQVGVNYQVNGFVFGVEGDFSYSGFNDDEEDDRFYALGEGDAEGLGIDTLGWRDASGDWLATVRGRAGLTFDRFLVYATGGVAFSDVRDESFFDADFDDDEDDDVKVGWTVGAGVEGFITPNITAKLEYLYVRFDNDEDKFDFGAAFDDDDDDHIDAHLVRAGLNIKFGW